MVWMRGLAALALAVGMGVSGCASLRAGLHVSGRISGKYSIGSYSLPKTYEARYVERYGDRKMYYLRSHRDFVTFRKQRSDLYVEFLAGVHQCNYDSVITDTPEIEVLRKVGIEQGANLIVLQREPFHDKLGRLCIEGDLYAAVPATAEEHAKRRNVFE